VRACLAFLVTLLSVAAVSGCGGDKPQTSPTSSAFPRIDGTVNPLNPGSVAPFTVKADPDPQTQASTLKDVRIGVHPEAGGWDRIVFEFDGQLAATDIRYQPRASPCAAGFPIAIQGAAVLEVRFDGAGAHDDSGKLTLARTQLQGPGEAILEALQTCDFEAQLTWAFAMKGERPFKVTTLPNPPRLVIDVKW
jgi:hypothetical protein